MESEVKKKLGPVPWCPICHNNIYFWGCSVGKCGKPSKPQEPPIPPEPESGSEVVTDGEAYCANVSPPAAPSEMGAVPNLMSTVKLPIHMDQWMVWNNDGTMFLTNEMQWVCNVINAVYSPTGLLARLAAAEEENARLKKSLEAL